MNSGITPNMTVLLERYGFDSVADRRRAVAMVGLPSASRVLDIGTGSGWMAFVLAQAGHAVTSVDIDAATLKRAQGRARQVGQDIVQHVRFLQADALELPFDDGQFDAVFSFDSMHHLPDCKRAICEMLRVCRRGGIVVVADLNQRGLAAVRRVIAQSGQRHEENQCRVDLIGRILAEWPGQVVRHDWDFITCFVLCRFARHNVDAVTTEGPELCRATAVPLELCATVPVKVVPGTED